MGAERTEQLVRSSTVLMLDLSMPGRSGMELIKLVHRDHPHLPILILSMHHEDQSLLSG